MGRAFFVIAVMVFSLLMGKCDKTPEDDIYGIDDNGGENYPNDVEEPAGVYFGPDYYEDDDDEKYPNDVDEPADVYFGPEYYEDDDDEKYPNDVDEPADVYFGPEYYEDDND